ncbi:uroporphyrinogen-III synthase [Arcobacter porcinus]|uniref:Uroporphyrinogen-III synthase n=1 Tax=Arcobacter porcinus TaxID=1935204 RepID=A0A5C2HEM3_9BACT|nr:uroporphyrinogen-III synthase [Arcobacter porcinus]OCL96763.1 uroporphyrinogen-III synthase [Aliarcobacter thereius]QEP40594.1 uroporphyrinogen III synthase [Arcobacter porcinus]
MAKIYLLNNQKYDGVVNLEVFKVESTKYEIDCSKYDALVFTSKNAIYSLEENSINWRNIPSYLIAEKTAKVAKDYNANIAFIGTNGHGNEFAKELVPLLKNKKVLYVKALKTVSNLVGILKDNDIELDEIVSYKTVCNDFLEKVELEKNSTIIFTSPSSVECFFNNFKWDKSFKAVLIGKTTEKFLPKEVDDYVISKTTDVTECVNIAKRSFS